ncbi:MAG: DUF5017 domain-containing protein [Prevotellaceae bacterium]|jgi:hypothetical protein|nr:DUF5017 domain-containing protein [Prevotellaceae bacterium]
MKKILSMVAVVALGSLLWSCTKDKNDNPNPNPGPDPVDAGLILNETFGTTATQTGTAWPNAAAYTGYSKTGAGAANVEYVAESGTVTVRSNSPSTYTGASKVCNAMMGAAGATLVVKNIAACGAAKMTLSFGSNQMSDTLAVSYSPDNGSTWAPLTYSKESTNWGLVSGISFELPAGTTCFALKFAGAKTTYGVRVDDITVKTTDATGTPANCGNVDPEPPTGDQVLNETLLTQGSFDKFTAYSVTGTEAWEFDALYGAKMSGYITATAENEDWFISPAIDLAGATSANLTFDHARGPAGSMSVSTSNYSLWISTDYTSGDPSAATWTELTIPTHGTTAWAYVSSGQIELTQKAASTRFAFKYVCDNAESATWEIKNIVVRAEGVAPVPMLSFTSASSASGRAEEAFSHTFTVEETNVTEATSFAVTAGALPAGLTLNGATISGTPTEAGATTFTVTATNGTATATQPFTITVTPAGGLFENFETSTPDLAKKSGYTGAAYTLSSGSWYIVGIGSMTAGTDRFNGTESTRLRGSATSSSGVDATDAGLNRVEMSFDKATGAGEVSFAYGSYGTHSGGALKVQISTDQGVTWVDKGEPLVAESWSAAGNVMKTATVTVNQAGSVRVRIIKPAQDGSTSVCIDDILISDYSN